MATLPRTALLLLLLLLQSRTFAKQLRQLQGPGGIARGAETARTAAADFVCAPGPEGIECRQQAPVLLLERAGQHSWYQAHRLCRKRDMFLVPSRRVLDVLLTTPLLSSHLNGAGRVWLGARTIPPASTDARLYQWLLPEGEEFFNTIPAEGSATVRLCLAHVGGSSGSQEWLPCHDRLAVLCVSAASTQAATASAGYRPHLRVIGIPTSPPARSNGYIPPVFRQVQLPPDTYYALDGSRFNSPEQQQLLTLECQPGERVVKDGVIIGTRVFSARQANSIRGLILSNFVAKGELQSVNVLLGAGSYWCERYVTGEVDPVRSGQLHVVPSADLQVLSAPRDQVTRQFLSLFSNVPGRDGASEYEYGPGLTDSFLESIAGLPVSDQISKVGNILRGASPRLTYLTIDSYAEGQHDKLDPGNVTVWLVTATSFEVPAGVSVRSGLFCPALETSGSFWRQEEGSFTDGLMAYYPVTSQPPCYGEGGLRLLRCQCVPSLNRGARWGPTCTTDRQRFPEDSLQCRSKACLPNYILQDIPSVFSSDS